MLNSSNGRPNVRRSVYIVEKRLPGQPGTWGRHVIPSSLDNHHQPPSLVSASLKAILRRLLRSEDQLNEGGREVGDFFVSRCHFGTDPAPAGSVTLLLELTPHPLTNDEATLIRLSAGIQRLPLPPHMLAQVSSQLEAAVLNDRDDDYLWDFLPESLLDFLDRKKGTFQNFGLSFPLEKIRACFSDIRASSSEIEGGRPHFFTLRIDMVSIDSTFRFSWYESGRSASTIIQERDIIFHHIYWYRYSDQD